MQWGVILAGVGIVVALLAWWFPSPLRESSEAQAASPSPPATGPTPNEQEASTSSPEEIPSTYSPFEEPGPGPEVTGGVQETNDSPAPEEEAEEVTIAGSEARPTPREEQAADSPSRAPSSWIERMFGGRASPEPGR